MTTQTLRKEGKITSKGQITLPASWRKKVGNPEKITLIEKDGILEIHPIEDENWITIYEAPKNTRGMSGEDFLDLINKTVNDKKDR